MDCIEQICITLGGVLKLQYALAIRPDVQYDFIFDEDTCSYTKDRKRDEAGTSFIHKLSFEITRPQKVIDDWLAENAEQYFLFVLTDLNGYKHEIGSIENPIELRENVSTGNSPEDKARYLFNFQAETPL